MRRQDRYDSLIQFYAETYQLDWGLIKRQMLAESAAQPQAISPVGAQGLMQFMPGTWRMWGRGDPFNPEESINAGCAYMAHLFSAYGEIPDKTERYRFALAAYNAGRGNINRLLTLARQECGQPGSYAAWIKAGAKPGAWQTWTFASALLHRVTGRHAKETLDYVSKIMGV